MRTMGSISATTPPPPNLVGFWWQTQEIQQAQLGSSAGTYAESGPTQFDNFRYYFQVTNYLKI